MQGITSSGFEHPQNSNPGVHVVESTSPNFLMRNS
jgi:hypothetical protein